MAKTGHPNFVYLVRSPWRVQPHTWSITGGHSGTSFSAADAQTFMTAANSPFALSYAPFLTAHANSGSPSYANFAHQVVGARYYDGVNSAPVWEAEYSLENPPPTTLLPTGAAYLAGSVTSAPWTSLESCARLVAQIGVNKKNRPIFVAKYLHGLPSGATAVTTDGGCAVQLSAEGGTAMEDQSNGNWAGSRVYVTPSGAQPSAAAWECIPGQHQMPRGRKKRPATQSNALSNLLLQALESGAISLGASALADVL